MTYVIEVLHYYQNPNEPHKQIIIDNGEYYMRYALFKALIESQKDFNITSKNIKISYDNKKNIISKVIK